MRIADFTLEKWLNPKDETAKYNLGASCVKAFQVGEFLEFIGENPERFFAGEVRGMSLHYGFFFGMPRLLSAISAMYRDVTPGQVLTVHGGTGANNLVLTELLEPGDNVVAFLPNYQQHSSTPESLGIEVRSLRLRSERQYLPDLDELRRVVDGKTRLITLSNPNNPTGAFIREPMLREIAEIARGVGAYILCDEIYRGLADEYMASIVDVSNKGIVSSSMSKVFSMAGTRVGWIITKDPEAYARFENRRSYDTICCGPFDELMAAKCLEHAEKVLARSREIVRVNKKIFDEWIARQPGLHCEYDSFGTTVFITYDYDVSATDLCTDIFETTGVSLCHGDCFDVPKSFRLGYGFGMPDHFRNGLEALGEYFGRLDGRGPVTRARGTVSR